MKEVKAPKPLRNDVMLENPLFGKEELIEEMKHIPESQQNAYMAEHIDGLFEAVRVHSTGPNVQTVEEGDLVVISPEAITNEGMPFAEGQYVLVSERFIIALW